MINNDRIKKARAKLEGEAAAIRKHCDKLREIAAGPLLDKQNGKTVNARLYPIFAEAYGLAKGERWNGSTYYPGARWSDEYCAPLNLGHLPCLVLEKICRNWGAFEIPFLCDDCGKLDAVATRSAWAKAHSEYYNPHITTLCAFGGDIYDRLNPFRWHEQKPEND